MVDYDKIGQAIGKSQAESYARNDAKIEIVLEDIARQREEALESAQHQLWELEKDFDGKLDGVRDANSKEHLERLNGFVEESQKLEVLSAQLLAKHENIKDGEQGPQGEQGNDGKDGINMPLLEPVALELTKDYPKNTLGTHNGGLWISTKDTLGSPDSDPHAWECILDAMTSLEVDLQEDHTFKLSVRMGTGKMIEDTFKIPYPEHLGIYEEGKDYKSGNIVTKGNSFFQAIEDTDQHPPGNGWQQILTAPRGKQGPAGKSIEGPQGKPGRNGRDAVLPENFVEDIMALASESKVFEDGRSGAEAITSFRGYFVPDETYSRGDVVNDHSALHLCTSGGRFSSIGAGQDSWELMIGVPNFTMPAFMMWQGAWEQKTYAGGSVVRDGQWTMVATTQTNERAAPVAIGPEVYPYQGTMTPFENTAKTVLYGQRYANLDHDVFVNGYKIDVITDNQYQIYLVTDVTTTPVFNLLISFVADTTGQREFSIPQKPFPQGEVFDIVVYLTEPAATPVEVVYQYDYLTPQNLLTPLAGQISHGRGTPDTMRISHTDNLGNDRTVAITGLDVGDTITAGVITWSVQTNQNNGTFSTITVTPATTSTAGVQDITFETTVATPITIGRDVDYWASNPNVVGLFVADGNYDDIVPSQNAYGIVDVLFQDAVVPEDWDIVTPGESGATASALTAKDTRWVQENSTPLLSGSVITTGAAWEEIGRLTISNAIKATIAIDAKRTDGIAYHVSEWVLLAWNDAGTLTSNFQKDIEIGIDLSVAVEEDGQDVVVKVKGKPNQDWDWRITAFYRELH